MTPPSLQLYYIPTCSYCLKVLHFMEENKISIPLVNRDENSSNRAQLMKLGRKPQVPCLIINGKPLYESDEIIEWLNKYRV